MALTGEDRRIRALRPPKEAIDPFRPLGVVVEPERRPDGALEQAMTVFLAGAECPFTCVFCDLWRRTLDGPTPPGALPRQLRRALAGLEPTATRRRLKLYNASNFFEPRAVPPQDLEALAALAAPFAGVTVESHPRLTGRRCREFAGSLDGRLEVAIGLETVHPGALPLLNKKVTVGDFDRAAERLRAWDVDLRAFVLLGTPFVPFAEQVEWTVRSVEHALARGAAAVAIIPVRGGNGELERLAARGEFAPPRLDELETALDECLGLGPGVVTADLWDIERLAHCPGCRTARLERLRRLNLTGRPEPRIDCAACSGT